MIRILLCSLLVAACGASRTTYARYPGAPAAFDRAGADPKALAIADKVFAAAGGAAWDKAKQLRWEQTVTENGQVKGDGEEAWDRWNARHWGLLHREDGDVAVGYELYGSTQIAYAQRGQKKLKLDDASRTHAIEVAKTRFPLDTATLALQFMMLEPGAKLQYIGTTHDDAGADGADDVQVTFADPMYKDYEFHAIVDRASSTIARVEIVKAGTTQKIGYALGDWVTVNGLKFATSRKDLGSDDTVAIKNLKVSDPEDDLFIAPLE